MSTLLFIDAGVAFVEALSLQPSRVERTPLDATFFDLKFARVWSQFTYASVRKTGQPPVFPYFNTV